VIKKDQVFMQLHTKDFSFVGEKPISGLYSLFASLHIRPNLIQSGAVSIQLCLDNREEKIEKLAHSAGDIFDVEMGKGFMLLTIRHYQKGLLEGMTSGREIRLLQQTPDTVQVLMKESV
jgi:aspartate kinase